MPATPNYGIVYPCSGSQIDCDVFAEFTDSVQSALMSLDTLQAQAQSMPSASIRRNSGSSPLTINVATSVQFDQEEWDNDGMANLGANNDRLTVQTPGIYMVMFHGQQGGTFTTLTSQAASLALNGTTWYRKKQGSTTNRNFPTQVFGLLECAAGDIIQAQWLWTGTGGPDTLFIAGMVARCVTLI
jgi:hypothetical protein